MNRRSLALLALSAAVIPSGVVPPPPAVTPPPVDLERPRRQSRPSKCGRESGRGSRPCAPKTGTSYADDARRTKAEAKRKRKASRNLAACVCGPADTGRTP